MKSVLSVFLKLKSSKKEAFHTWKRATLVEKRLKKRKEELDAEIENVAYKKKRIDRKIIDLTEEIEEGEKRYNHLHSLVKDNKKKISNYESKGRELSNDINQILDKGSKTRGEPSNIPSSQSKMKSLQNRLATAMAENQELNRQIELTNENVKMFINEMGSVISTHEVCQTVQPIEDGNEMFDERYRQPHRGIQQTT